MGPRKRKKWKERGKKTKANEEKNKWRIKERKGLLCKDGTHDRKPLAALRYEPHNAG